MQFKEGEITVSTPGADHPEHTKLFVSVLTRMLNKGIDNPAFQLHALSLLCTGKSFIELITKNNADSEQLVEAAKTMAEGLLDVIVQTGDMSGTTIDDILDNLGRRN